MNAVQAFSRIMRTNVSPSNNKYEDYGASYEYAKTIVDGGAKFGLGVCYDQISGEGVSFQEVPFGLQLTSDISTDSPQGIWLFAHCKNTVVSTSSGIQILN